MGYMRIKHKDESSLVLLREPTAFSIAVFFAFLIGSIGVFIFGSEPLFFKLLITLGTIGLSCVLLDNYEICEFDKTKSEVRTTSLHWCQFWMGNLVGLTLQPNVVAKLEDIRDVRVEEQGEGNSVKGYQVILILETGQQLGVTEVFTTDDVSSHDKIRDAIKQFLKDYVVSPTADADDEAKGTDEDDEEEDQEDSTEDDFEQISQSELEGLKEAPAGGSGDCTVPEGGAADGGEAMGVVEEAGTDQGKAGDEASS